MDVANVLTWAKDTANYLLYGPGANTSPSRKNTGPLFTEASPVRTSYVFDSHIVQEAQQQGKSKNPQTLSAAWDQYGQWGIEQSWQGMTAQDRKNVMLDIFLSTPAVSSCVEVISKRIFSGGFTVEKIDEEGPDNNQHRDQLMEFCLRVNEDWDFCQLGRSLVQDKLIFGESYSEILWKNGLPYNLVKVDCIPMGYKADKYGRIERFYQQMSSTREKNWLDPKDIIRWWFPHPRASIDPFAPVEKVTDAVLLSNKMTRWQIGFFQRGAKFPFYIKGVGDQAEAERYMAFFTENYTGEKNAHRPMITWGTAELAAIGNMGALDMDFGKGLDRQDILIYGGFGVPPAAVSVIKTGALGGDIGEDQDKSLIFNSCDPVKQAWLEKLNYRIVRQGFNITDYKISLHYADYRSDKDVAEVEDKRIRNGSRTIDEIRVEGGKRPYKTGGDVAVIVTTKEVTPVSRFADLEDESRQNAQVALDTAKANADLAKEKVKQAQKPPEPVPPALPGEKQPGEPIQGQKQAQKQASAPQEKTESQQIHTGVMVAFMLDRQTADQLALSGGEDPDQLHLTLAFLGDMADFDMQRLPLLQSALSNLAKNHYALQGKIAGLGRFQAPDGQSDPVIALPDIPGLAEFRQALVYTLADVLVPANTDHGFTPHITLAYIDKSDNMPLRSVENVPLYFDSVCLAVGGERFYYPLLGQKTESVEPKVSTSPVPDNLWIRPDIDAKLQELAEQDVVEVTWGDHPGSCDMCANNAGVTVKLGENFPSGHPLAPAHPNCECPMLYTKSDGTQILEKTVTDLNALQAGNDPDDTQKLPVVRKVVSRDE